MPSQFIIKKNEVIGGWDCYTRDLVSHGEYRARFDHMTNDCGMTPEEVAIELYHMVGFFVRATDCPTSRRLCETFVFDHIETGDIVQIDYHYYVVNAPSEA